MENCPFLACSSLIAVIRIFHFRILSDCPGGIEILFVDLTPVSLVGIGNLKIRDPINNGLSQWWYQILTLIQTFSLPLSGMLIQTGPHSLAFLDGITILNNQPEQTPSKARSSTRSSNKGSVV